VQTYKIRERGEESLKKRQPVGSEGDVYGEAKKTGGKSSKTCYEKIYGRPRRRREYLVMTEKDA